MKRKIYLDDVRTPYDSSWIVVRSYEEFIKKVAELGLENIETVSLDHDLDETAMQEYFNNVSPNYKLDYLNIKEKTGRDCAMWLIDHFYQTNNSWSSKSRSEKRSTPIKFPLVLTHSANPIGSANIMGCINNFFMNEAQPQTCVRVQIDHYE